MESIWASEESLGHLDKGKDRIMIKRVKNKTGKEFVDIRIFYENDAEEWIPTKKGLTIPIEIYPDFLEQLDKARPE
ncbi:MAG: transcriptional coactivator p15/PC4 family protein [Solirubrobacterales bacterium]